MLARKNYQRNILLVVVALLISCKQQLDQDSKYPYQYTGLTMGTTYSIKASKIPETLSAQDITVEVEKLLEKINSQMSTYDNQSELSIFNANPSTDWQTVSPELYTVLHEALKISELSGGLFDVTVGPLVNLWGFGPEELAVKSPDDKLIDERRKLVGFHHLTLNPDGKHIKKDIPNLYVDLSAIAKGYGVDQVASILEHLGIGDYMVEIGGEIRVKGKNKDGESWRIAVEKPTEQSRAIEKILKITDTGMATSGDYRNYFEVNGVRFSHEIDPRTGRPITNKLASVTTLQETSMEADAMATAIMVMGPDEGFQFTEKYNIPAFFIIKTANGFAERMSTTFLNSNKVTK